MGEVVKLNPDIADTTILRRLMETIQEMHDISEYFTANGQHIEAHKMVIASQYAMTAAEKLWSRIKQTRGIK